MPISAPPPSWASIKNKPNTVAGFGISDMASQSVNQANKLANDGGSAPSYACRAWVNFNGTGTVAIRASGNVSSITDNGVGDYTVNFTTAMPDENYAVVFGTVAYGSDQTPTVGCIRGNSSNSGPNLMTTSAVQISIHATNTIGTRDLHANEVAIFR